MEEISVKKSAVIRFRVAELMRKIYKLVTACKYRMEAIR